MMEKVNELSKFKKRHIDYMYTHNEIFNLNLDLDILHPQRLHYAVPEENLSKFLDYVKYLTIPELGISARKVHVTRTIIKGKYSSFRNVFISVTGRKEDVRNLDVVLKRLCKGLTNKERT